MLTNTHDVIYPFGNDHLNARKQSIVDCFLQKTKYVLLFHFGHVTNEKKVHSKG
jgi:hypothetical protein